MNAFHAYDIRGIYGIDFNLQDVYKIGFYLPGLLKTDKVLVGRDIRTSSPEIFTELSRGISDAGADVYNAGLTTTPMVYWSTAKHGFDVSVMITASHNPKEYNGMKISKGNALPVGYDTGLKHLEDKLKSGEPIIPVKQKGKIIDQDIQAEYLKFQQNYLRDISNLKISIDCSNGMAGIIIRQLLGDSPVYINEEPDGNFPNHEPNPLLPENVIQLQQSVIKNKSDIGVIFDGDADRVMFVDEQGNFVSPDLIIAFLGHYFLKDPSKKIPVLQDIRTSKSVGEYLEKMGAEVYTWRVGRAYAALKLREIDGLFGGELAGHYYFRDFYYSDSGVLAALLVLGLVNGFKKQGKSFSSLISEIKNYENSGEINFKIEQKKEAMDAVKNHFMETEKVLKFYDFDGYRIEFETWWFNIRPSNTEPYLRLLVEAHSTAQLKEKIQIIKNIIESTETNADK